MANVEVKVKCKRCGRLSPSTKYILDDKLKTMICPLCVKEMREQAHINETQQKKEESQKNKPVGWDQEDEFIEKMYKEKQKLNVNFQRIDGERVKYKCPRCNYLFVYSLTKKFPSTCPACGNSVSISAVKY